MISSPRWLLLACALSSCSPASKPPPTPSPVASVTPKAVPSKTPVEVTGPVHFLPPGRLSFECQSPMTRAFSQDGKLLVTAPSDPCSHTPLEHVVRFWDTSTGALRATLRPPDGSILQMALSPSARRLAVSYLNTVVVHDLSTLAEVKRIPVVHSPTWLLRFIPGSESRLVRELDKAFELIDIDAGTAQMLPGSKAAGTSRPRQGPVLTTRGERLLAQDSVLGTERRAHVSIIDLDKGAERRGIDLGDGQNSRELLAVAIDPQGDKIAAGWSDGFIETWGIDAGQPIGRWRAHKNGPAWGVRRLLWGRDGNALLSWGEDKMLHVWDAPKGASKAHLEDIDEPSSMGVVAGARPQLDRWSFCASKSAVVWEPQTESYTRSPFHDPVKKGDRSCETAPQGDVFAWTAFGQVVLWTMDADAFVGPGLAPEPRALRAQWADAGRSLIVEQDKLLSVLDVQSLKARWSLKASGINSAALLSPDGAVLAMTGYGQTEARLVRVETGEVIRALPTPARDDQGITAAFSANGALLAMNVKSEVTVLEVSTGKKLHSIPKGNAGVERLAWNPKDGSLAVVAVTGLPPLTPFSVAPIACDVMIWNLEKKSARPVYSFQSVGECLRDLTFSPDGAWLAGANHSGGEVVVLDVARGRLIRKPSSSGSVKDLPWSPDGSALAVRFDNGKVELWTPGPFEVSARDIEGDAGVHGLSFHPSAPILALGLAGGARFLRLSDGSSIWMLLRDPPAASAVVVAEDGSYDGDESLLGSARFRVGDDVMRGPIKTGVELGAARRRPGLLGQFVAAAGSQKN